MKIPFNKPFLTGNETKYIQDAVSSGKISGNGKYTQKCQAYFEEKYGFHKCLLTTSCTDALEMCALLLDIAPGDEIILPSFTFVSTANAFILRGAHLVFADSSPDSPNIDASKLETLITPRTKAIVVVHYAGIACDMDPIVELASRHKLFIIEDAAQAIDSYYKGRPLGSIGHLAAFSFHETKNIISGEGGMLVINDPKFAKRAEIIWEKGTNRSAFFRGEVDKYGWVDLGSSFLPSEIVSAFLFAQLENLESIQGIRKQLWDRYNSALSQQNDRDRPIVQEIPTYATNNAHMFYILCSDAQERQKLIDTFKENDILAVFHYISLHESQYFASKHDGRDLPYCNYYSDRLLRLPLYCTLTEQDQQRVLNVVENFYNRQTSPVTTDGAS